MRQKAAADVTMDVYDSCISTLAESQGTHRIIFKGCTHVQYSMILQQLDVSRLQITVHAQLVRLGQGIEPPQRLQLLVCHAGHLCMPLCQLVVGCRVVDAQVALQ